MDGRYALEGELGRGGMGVVYLARDTGLRRQIAVKLIAPALAENPIIAARFHDEARALASVQSRHVVQVYSLGRHDETYFSSASFAAQRATRSCAGHRPRRSTRSILRASPSGVIG